MDEMLGFWDKEEEGRYILLSSKDEMLFDKKGLPWVQTVMRGILGSEKAEVAKIIQTRKLLIKKTKGRLRKWCQQHMYQGLR